MEQLVLEIVSSHMKKKIITSSQQGFTKGKPGLTNLINFYNEITSLMDEEGTLDVVFLNFSKAFDALPHKILTEKMLNYGLGEQTARWIKNWLSGQTQRVLVSGAKSI